MKFAVMIFLFLSSAAMADQSDNSCKAFDEIKAEPSYNDSMDAYKYETLSNGDTKVCFKTYASDTCGCFVEPRSK